MYIYSSEFFYQYTKSNKVKGYDITLLKILKLLFIEKAYEHAFFLSYYRIFYISILMHTSQFDTLLFQYQKETESLHIIEIYVGNFVVMTKGEIKIQKSYKEGILPIYF